MIHPLFVGYFVLLSALCLAQVSSQDVVGCGGFVESTVPIKYEKVEVRENILDNA